MLHAVTVAALRATFTEGESAAVPAAVGGVEAEEWLASLIQQACDRVAGSINACPRNPRIATGISKLPAECVHIALVLARHAVISAVPGMASTLEGSTRAAEYATATRDLDRLAACELLPSYALEPDEAAEAYAGAAVQIRAASPSEYLF